MQNVDFFFICSMLVLSSSTWCSSWYCVLIYLLSMDINDEHVVGWKNLILLLQSLIFKSIFLYLLKFCAECYSCNQHQGGHHYVCVSTMSYVCLQLGFVAFRVPSLNEIEVNNWFSILFFIMEYYNSCWFQNFQMKSKETLFAIVDHFGASNSKARHMQQVVYPNGGM